MIEAQISRFGGPQVFKVVEKPSPAISPGHVRIKVSAAGVNFADVQMRMGLYPEAPRVPFVPGYEVAGVIAEIGPDVDAFRLGERVMAACRFGGYVDEIVLPAWQVRPTPRRLTDAEAAAIPVAFMTAWIGLVTMARVREDDRVLIPGAAGGVGSALVQIAARAGAQVLGLVGSADKKEIVRGFGAGQVLTYDELNGRGSADDQGFTLILDARGGAALKDSIRRLAPGGRVISYGVSSIVSGERRSVAHTLSSLIHTPIFTSIGLAMSNKGVYGLNMLKLFDSAPGRQLLGDALDGILEGFKSGELKVHIGKTFALANVGAAHTWLQSRKNIGKVVLNCR